MRYEIPDWHKVTEQNTITGKVTTEGYFRSAKEANSWVVLKTASLSDINKGKIIYKAEKSK